MMLCFCTTVCNLCFFLRAKNLHLPYIIQHIYEHQYSCYCSHHYPSPGLGFHLIAQVFHQVLVMGQRTPQHVLDIAGDVLILFNQTHKIYAEYNN